MRVEELLYIFFSDAPIPPFHYRSDTDTFDGRNRSNTDTLPHRHFSQETASNLNNSNTFAYLINWFQLWPSITKITIVYGFNESHFVAYYCFHCTNSASNWLLSKNSWLISPLAQLHYVHLSHLEK